MKVFAAITTVIVGFSSPVFTAIASDGHKGHSSNHASTAMQMIDGVVKKIDPSGTKVTVSHGPLGNGMPAMTMVYRAKDTGWIKRMKVGSTIRYMAEEINGVMTIVHVEQTK